MEVDEWALHNAEARGCAAGAERCKIAICGLSPATAPPTISEAQSIKLQGEGVLGKKRLAGDTARAASSDEV